MARLVRVAAVTVLAASLLVVVLAAVVRVFGSHADYGEGPILAMIERIGQEPLSTRWLQGPPYTLSCYGPGYYWGVRAITALIPLEHSLVPGRSLSLLAILATTAMMAWVVRRHTQSIEMAMAAALVFLAAPPVHAWGTAHRVDSLAMLFAVGTYVAIGLPRYGIPASALSAVFGSLVKQTAAFAAVPVFVYLLLQKRYRAAAVYGVLVAGLGIAAWLALDMAEGGYCFDTAIQGNLNSMLFNQGFWNCHAFLSTPLGVGAAALAAYLFVKQPAAMMGSIWYVGLVTSTLIAALLSSKEGSATSYYMEACAMAAMVIGVHGLAALESLHCGRALAMTALLACAIAAPDLRLIRQEGLALEHVPYGDPLVHRRVVKLKNAYVLADGQHMEAVLQAGLLPLVNDPYLFRLLVDNGGLTSARVIQAIEQGEVKNLVLKKPVEEHKRQIGAVDQKWPPEVLDAMQRHFVLDAAQENLFVYRPRGRIR